MVRARYSGSTRGLSKNSTPTRPVQEVLSPEERKSKVVYVADGGPITYGTAANATLGFAAIHSYASLLHAVNFAEPYRNLAVAANNSTIGRVDSHANGHSPAIFTYLPEDDLYTAQAGASNATFTTYLSNLGSYLAARRAAGYTVVFLTSLPRSEPVEWNGGWDNYWRLLQNNTVTSWIGTNIDSVCDFGGISAMNNVSNTAIYTPWHGTANSTFSAGVFPTEYAHTILADFLKDHLKTVHYVKI